MTLPHTTPVTGIDTHAHVLRTDHPLTASRHSQPSKDASITEYLSLLEAHGLSHGVLTAPSFYGDNNSLLLEALEAAPHRLRGTVCVTPKTTTEEELQALASRGVVGIRLNWSRRSDRPDPNSPTHRRLFQAAAKSGLHVEVLIEDAHLPAIADAVLGEGAVLVIDHFGLAAGVRTPGAAAMVRALEGGSAWVKLSAPYRPPTSELRRLSEALLSAAPHRLLWGSDWPWVQHENDVSDYGACLSALDHLVPDPVLRTAVLVDNPAQLLGLP
ncbi:amidohydrolase family protein [Streptomyces sp. RLB3-6]|uniref:amidohydrolase family protein n=1 Tax=Streptomyces sp. RLB3-6 TaxID=2594457 RepID=UPI0011647D36|nr:amidohydrolase family protein [Streptomyces sp. RLB3-6]QDN93462.1 amidohydrolase family protein [Streptomyces sp. RLB3-6]